MAVAGALYAGVLAWRLADDDPAEALSLLYALPVALVAVTFGLRGGVAAAAFAVGLTVAWAVVRDVSFAPAGWAARVVPLMLLGALVGHATDRAREALLAQRLLEESKLLHRHAIEINDSLVQGMAAAKWRLEAGQVETGLTLLDDTLTRAQDLVSGLIRHAQMGGSSERLDA